MIDILFLGGTSVDLIKEGRGRSSRIKFTASVGGSITNSSVIGSKLGLKTAMLSRIGKDMLGDFAVGFLKDSRVNTSGIIQDPDIHTPIAIADIDKSGSSRYTFYKNSPEESIVPLEGVPEYLLSGCKIFHFGSSFSYQEGTSEEVLKYIKLLKKRGVFISFDPNTRPYAIKDKPAAKNRTLRLLKWADLVKLSEMDLRFLTGQKGLQKGLKMLKKKLSAEVILTLGAKGAIYRNKKDRFIRIPAFKVKVVDTIGAGDGFTAGLLFRLRKIGKRRFFEDLRLNIIFASAVSSLICAGKGANEGLKDIKQVRSFLSKR